MPVFFDSPVLAHPIDHGREDYYSPIARYLQHHGEKPTLLFLLFKFKNRFPHRQKIDLNEDEQNRVVIALVKKIKNSLVLTVSAW